jgi:ribosomal protein S27AE
MREIAQMTQIIVKRAKEYDNDTIPGDYATLQTPCPNCGGVVKENYRRFACTKCEFSMSKVPAAASSRSPKWKSCCRTAPSVRCRASAPRWAVRSRPS